MLDAFWSEPFFLGKRFPELRPGQAPGPLRPGFASVTAGPPSPTPTCAASFFQRVTAARPPAPPAGGRRVPERAGPAGGPARPRRPVGPRRRRGRKTDGTNTPALAGKRHNP